MRRIAAAVAAAACLAVAGCGGDAGSPLDEALGYLPEDAPLALIVSTDLEDQQFQDAERAARGVPFGPALLDALRSEFEGDGVDFEEDIRPLLGNEAVIGVTELGALLSGEVEGFVAALETEDADRLEELAQRGTEEAGEAAGATLYRADDDTFLGVNDDVLVIADSEDRLRQALERRDSDDRLREEDVEPAFEDLPEDAPVRLYGNVEALVDAASESARRIPFVEALSTFGAAATVEEGGEAVELELALRTDEEVDEDQLPIAAGEEAPAVIGREGEIAVGIRNPARIVAFAESVAQAVSPQGFAEYETAKRQIAQGLGVDLDRDLFAQFTGNTSVAIDLDGDFAVRSQLANPRAFERTLERLVRVIPSFAEGAGFGEVGVARPSRGEDFYAIAGEGGEGLVYGVVDDVFVLANDARRAGDLASEQPQQVEGAEGAVVVRADAGAIAGELLARLLDGEDGEDGEAADLGLGPITGSLAADANGLRGTFTLDLRR